VTNPRRSTHIKFSELYGGHAPSLRPLIKKRGKFEANLGHERQLEDIAKAGKEGRHLMLYFKMQREIMPASGYE
jgi:hypothetical protein